jgi:hypothetical protein
MKVEIVSPPPVPQPPKTVKLELTEREAQMLKKIVGSISGGRGTVPLSFTFIDNLFSPVTLRADLVDPLYYALDAKGI